MVVGRDGSQELRLIGVRVGLFGEVEEVLAHRRGVTEASPGHEVPLAGQGVDVDGVWTVGRFVGVAAADRVIVVAVPAALLSTLWAEAARP
ncbi:hypothetical protein [Streptomyces sp. NPDC059371]|uniref:hypothetical protein n=1 Tax=Streptomyces sp. NPDC059371 TaxID=3346812 RepID=UPI0036BAC3ED